MAKPFHRRSCSVLGCTSQHSSLHKVPSSGDRREEWIRFIYDNNVPATVNKILSVCGNHFSPESFSNYGPYEAGLAQKLYLTADAKPTIRTGRLAEHASAYENLEVEHRHVRNVACQTDPPPRHTVGTQLSLKTLLPNVRSKGTQKTVSCTDVGVGTSTSACTDSPTFLSSTSVERPCKRPRLELEEEEEDPLKDASWIHSEKTNDSTYDHAASVTSLTDSEDVAMDSSSQVHKTPTYIVYESCLLELLEKCPVCMQVSEVHTRKMGTFLSVEQCCPHCHFLRKWNSQPILGSTPAGNLQLSAAVYANGASFFKIEKIFQTMQLQMFQYDTFRRHARMFIEPAIVHKWKTTQDGLLETLSQQQNVILGGDMSADSPGNSAKLRSYTMMDLRSNTVVDVQLVQSNEVGGSYHMEKEGLKRSLALLETRGVTLDSIVTNRHPQIQKYLREANITQYYDVWHMEKALSKKLLRISQKRDCIKLQKWLPRIKKHIYWTAASSISGPERVAKWTSILNHVQDIHTHEDPLFPKCLHPQRTTEDESNWLTAETPAFNRLEKVLTSKRVLKDIEKLSPHSQTSSLEAFHRVILRFAPKNVWFPFLGMLCRLYLAALHFNENAGRLQATTSTIERKVDCAGKPVKGETTFCYRDELLDLIFGEVFQDPAPYVDEVLKISRLPEAL